MTRLPLPLRGYVLAVVLVSAALLLRLHVLPLGGRSPFLAFYPAVAVAAWAGGLAPGLAGVLLSAAAGNYVLSRFEAPAAEFGGAYTETGAFLAVAGFLAYLVARLRDERARAEEQAAAARAAVRLRDEFLAAAAHELRTPLTALRATAQLLQRLMAGGSQLDPERVERGLGVLAEQTRKLDRLVGNLFDAARVDTGRLDLDVADADLVAVVHRAADKARATAPDREIAVAAPERLPLPADERRIEQVVMNLLENAARFSPSGTPVEVALAATAGGARLVVRDRGTGVPHQHRPNLFGRFHQAHATDHASGLGLGLYVSREIVRLHGGDIQAEFPAEGGTRFVVTLPRR